MKIKNILIDSGKISLVILFFGWFFWGTGSNGYNWQWYRIPRYLLKIENGMPVSGPLLNGLAITLKIIIISLIFSFILGLLTAVLRMSESFIANILARIYLEIIRNTPLLVQLFLIYFVLGPILNIDRLPSAVLALSLFEGAYASEIFRAGILSVNQGQWEASHSLGLNKYQAYRYIVLPQAVKKILPPLTSQAVSLIKDSALVSAIAVYDLTMKAQEIISETYLVFEVWFTVAFIYLLLTVSLSVCVNIMKKRFAFGDEF